VCRGGKRVEPFVISSDKYRADEKCFASNSMLQTPQGEVDITLRGIPYFKEPQRIIYIYIYIMINNLIFMDLCIVV